SSRGGISVVQRKQSRRRAAGRDEEGAAAHSKPLRVARGRCMREGAGPRVDGFERNGLEFSVRRRIELDRKAQAFGVVAVAHGDRRSCAKLSSYAEMAMRCDRLRPA